MTTSRHPDAGATLRRPARDADGSRRPRVAVRPSTARLTDDTELAYRCAGVGTDLCFVQDLTLAGFGAERCAERLRGRGFRVLTYDLRDQGGSGRGARELSPTTHASDLGELLDALSIDDVYLIGTSLGTLIARDFAMARPERVRGMVLVGPTFGPLGGGRRKQLTRHWLRVLERDGLDGVFASLYPVAFGDSTVEHGGSAAYLAFREWFLTQMTESRVERGLRATLASRDTPSDLARVRCPVRLVAGDGDLLVSPSTLLALAQLFTEATTESLRNVGHMACVEVEPVMATIIEDFVLRGSPS